MRLALTLLLLALALPARAATITLQIGDTVSVNGVLYTVTPALTLLTPAPVVVTPVVVVTPPVVAPPPVTDGGPVVNGYRNARRDPVTTQPVTLAAGTAAFLDGSRFGAAAGTVRCGVLPVVVVGWSDTEIAITVPPVGAAGQLTVTRADGLWYSSMGFQVVAAPP